jgi:predicted GIY-YIG superfamily endonuclease
MEKNQPDKTYIYGLADPTTKEIRYVGKADDPQARLSQHLQEKGSDSQ